MSGLKFFTIVPAYMGLTALIQTPDISAGNFDYGFWFSQGLAVALLCAVGIFFAKQIWPEMKEFFKAILVEQRSIGASISEVKQEIINSRDIPAQNRQCLQEQATLICAPKPRAA
jgi:hypothetical protein